MKTIMGFNVSDKTIALLKRVEKFNNLSYSKAAKEEDPYWKNNLIKNIIKSLCLDNHMIMPKQIILELNNPGGEWNNIDKILKLYFHEDMTETKELIGAIFHECRHIWQGYHLEVFDALGKRNTEVGFSSLYDEYRLQPIEEDAYKFTAEVLSQLDIELGRNDLGEHGRGDYESFLFTRDADKSNITSGGYFANEKYLLKLMDSREEVVKVRDDNPDIFFSDGKYSISLTENDDKIHFCIGHEIEYTYKDDKTGRYATTTGYEQIFAHCDDCCYIDDFMSPRLDPEQQPFNDILNVVQDMVRYYNDAYNKNISETKFSFRFLNMPKNKHNKLIRNCQFGNNLLKTFSLNLEKPFKMNLPEWSRLEPVILDAKSDKKKLILLIEKIKDNIKLDKDDFKLINKKYGDISVDIRGAIYDFPKDSEEIIDIFKTQLNRYGDNMNKILSYVLVKDALESKLLFTDDSGLDLKIEAGKTLTKEELSHTKHNIENNIEEKY